MRRKSEQGVALIAVLWMLTLLAIIAATLSLETRTDARIARNMAENAVARAAADAGVHRAIFGLLALPHGPQGAVQLGPADAAYDWQFGGATVRINIEDEASKIDLNQAPASVLSSLFVSVGVDEQKAQALGDAIVDFRTPPSSVGLGGGSIGGADEGDYQAAGFTWGPKHAPFQAIEELQQVVGMSPDVYDRVSPYLTIYAVGGAANPALANQNVASALHQAGFSSQSVSAPGIVYSIRAEARTRAGADFVREAVIQITPTLYLSFQMLAWREGSQG